MEEERFNFIWKNYCYKNACYSQAYSDRSDYSSQENIYRSTEKTVFTFIWGKCDRNRRNTLIAPVSEGGLNMSDIESFFLALKAAWFKRIILNNEDWSFIPRNMFSFCDNLKLLL